MSVIDLYADRQHWNLTAADRDRFVGQADTARTYLQGGALPGFDFDTRASHSMVTRIYDKTLDIRRTGATWWHDAWSDRHQPDIPVHRVEFELARATLRHFGLSTPAEVLAAQADLWAYATEQCETTNALTSPGREAGRDHRRRPVLTAAHGCLATHRPGGRHRGVADLLGDDPRTLYRHYRHRVRPAVEAAAGPMQTLLGETTNSPEH